MTSRDVLDRERFVPAQHRGSGRRQWAVLLAPILAIYAQQQIAYAFVTWACTKHMRYLVQLPTLLAITIVAVAASQAWRMFVASGRREAGDERSSDARARFMSASALTLAGFCTIVLVGMWLPTVFIHPCQR